MPTLLRVRSSRIAFISFSNAWCTQITLAMSAISASSAGAMMVTLRRVQLCSLLFAVVTLSVLWVFTVSSADSERAPPVRANLARWLGKSREMPSASHTAAPPAARSLPEGSGEGHTSSDVSRARSSPAGDARRVQPRVYFFAIVTQPLQFRRRAIIRSTWLRCLSSGAGGSSSHPDHPVELRHRFFIGAMTKQHRKEASATGGYAALALEMARHGDVVPLGNLEVYDNLTLKSQMVLQWTAREWSAATGQPLLVAPRLPRGQLPPSWDDGMQRLVDWADEENGDDDGRDHAGSVAPPHPGPGAGRGATGAELEALDGPLASALAQVQASAAHGARDGLRPWGQPFKGLPGALPGDDSSRRGRVTYAAAPRGAPVSGRGPIRTGRGMEAAAAAAAGASGEALVDSGGEDGPVLEYVIKTDADVMYCPGHIFTYGAALLAQGVKWKNWDLPPVLTPEQVARLHAPGAPLPFLWVGKGPYGNKSVIRDPKNYFHIPPSAYPGPVDPVFVPGPSYMMTGHLLRALAGTFPIAPQGVLDVWRGFEDKFLGMLVEQLALGRGVPLRVIGRYEHYMDYERPSKVKAPFCEEAWGTKLGVQVINYNESYPLPQFGCPGWSWPAEPDAEAAVAGGGGVEHGSTNTRARAPSQSGDSGPGRPP